MIPRALLLTLLVTAIVPAVPATAPADKFNFAGLVVDERGNPVAGAKVVSTYAVRGGYGYIDSCESDNAGWFVTNRRTALSGARPGSIGDAPITIKLSHPDFLREQLEDVQKLSPKERINLHITMRTGQSLSGKVLDAAGKPLEKVMVVAHFMDADDRRAANSAADGTFTLRGLQPESCNIQFRKVTSGAKILCGQSTVDLHQTAKPLEIVAQPFELPAGAVLHELLGMRLIDVDDNVRKRFGLHSSSRVMVLDPGADSARLDVGALEPCDAFWMVGNKRIRNFTDFARTLRAECEAQQKRGEAAFSVRVVYNFDRVDQDGSNTQQMKLTVDDLAELKKATEQ